MIERTPPPRRRSARSWLLAVPLVAGLVVAACSPGRSHKGTASPNCAIWTGGTACFSTPSDLPMGIGSPCWPERTLP